MKSAFLLSLAITFLMLKRITQAELQTIQLKSIHDNIEEIYSNVRDLSKVSKLIQQGESVEEICAGENSVWVVFNALNYSELDPNFEFQFLDASIPNKNCAPVFSSSQISFRHFGNLDTNISTLSLYKLTDYQGIELSFTGNSLDLPFPEYFLSFGFTGPDNWELFPEDGAGASSKSHCLQRPESYDIMAPFGISNYFQMKVKRIVRGCVGSGNNLFLMLATDTDQDNTDERPTLYLLGGTYPRGDIFIDGSEVRFTESFKNLHFTHFSPQPNFYSKSNKTWNNDWQVFSGRDFDGESICINPITLSFETEVTVGSMKVGCGHQVGALLEELPEAFKSVVGDSVSSPVILNIILLIIYCIQLLLI